MILSTEVEVKLNTRNVEYYKDLGYIIPMKEATELSKKVMHKDYVYDFSKPIIVKVEDLLKGSNAKLTLLCDYCQEEIFEQTNLTYQRTIKEIPKCACLKCRPLKTREVNMLKYNIPCASQTEEVKANRRKTIIEKYGTTNMWDVPEIKQKRINTCTEKYGVPFYSQTEEFKEKFVETCRKNRGTDYPTQNAEVREKIRLSVQKKYGTDNVFANEDIIEKIHKTMHKNGTTHTSRQQLYLHKLFGGVLNFPVKFYNLDICYPEEKFYIEYSGGGHFLSIILGNMTQEEFNHKEIVRNAVLKKEGYKKMEIISKKDLLPSDQILLQMLSDAKSYFSDYPNHSWCEYNLDLSILRNAEHKDGVPYNYGELRAIKEIA